MRQEEVLLARRPEGKKHAGLWEFPGGKIESQESLQEALVRELYEELGIEVINYSDFMDIRHQYDDYAVWLRVVLVTDFLGIEQGMEGQEIDWVALADLEKRDFPEANKAILEKLAKKLI